MYALASSLSIGSIENFEGLLHLGYILFVQWNVVVLAIGTFNIALYPFLGSSRFGSDPRFWSWKRAFTSTFAHGGPLHLMYNVLALCATGITVHYQLGCNHFNILLLYFLASLVSSAVSWRARKRKYTTSGIIVRSVGASGAISGLLGAQFVLAGGSTLYKIFGFTVMDIIRSFVHGGNVDLWAHFGGMVCGALFATVFQAM